MDDGVKLALLGSWMLLFGIFAARKFTQPIKVIIISFTYNHYNYCYNYNTQFPMILFSFFQDDIGDKSIFMFNSLSEYEKNALIQKIEQQKLDQNLD